MLNASPRIRFLRSLSPCCCKGACRNMNTGDVHDDAKVKCKNN